MDEKKENLTGVYQLENGRWAYRFVLTRDGKSRSYKRTKDDNGKPFRTQKQAARARQQALIKANLELDRRYVKIERRKYKEVYEEYCQHGRSDKAYATIRKQDSLWENHLRKKFGRRYVDEVTVAEINDYLAYLYYVEGRAYSYVESFLKMFYLILGQAYSRNYIDVDTYNKLCVNKDSKIHMPKRQIDDDDDVAVFSKNEMRELDKYFSGTTLETAYMLGKYCGLRINECFGVKWSDINLQKRTIYICRQMQYQQGVIKLVPVKTRNGKRTLYMSDALHDYLLRLRETICAAEVDLTEMREQRQMMIQDTDGTYISSLELVNTLPNGKMRTVNSFKRHTKKIKEELGIAFKYHYLRHTYGTRMAEMGTPAHILCRQMGHASSKVTEKYYLSMSESGVELLLDNLNKI